ncbi:exopolysaccharide biosynthesis protein [Ammoniphilus sp. CFH 90114]|uniref:exopolysaccharide biosynthesis protein n=1 Tax=Ammoniphilus sp. CFH 90114 TaxID=2493665 RepID=UPI0013E91A7F|nr:exopolysaccharide biosynthesis protein [Ammoniphilus sp. CFH 90114]
MKTSTSFSKTLKNLSVPSHGITLGKFLHDLGQQGILVGLAFLTIPFLFGVSIPGTSTPFGILIALVSWQLLLQRPVSIPRKFGNIQLSSASIVKLQNKSLPWIMRMEEKIKPRWISWFKSPLIRQCHIAVMMLSGILLTVPIPIPLTNAFPAYAVLLLSIGILERDGLLVFIGHTFFVTSILYFVFIGWIGTEGIMALWTSVF